jgi:hypothetical protein
MGSFSRPLHFLFLLMSFIDDCIDMAFRHLTGKGFIVMLPLLVID